MDKLKTAGSVLTEKQSSFDRNYICLKGLSKLANCGRMFFLNTSDALDVYRDGLVIHLSSLLTSKSATNALWIVPAANSLSIETTGKNEAPSPDCTAFLIASRELSSISIFNL